MSDEPKMLSAERLAEIRMLRGHIVNFHFADLKPYAHSGAEKVVIALDELFSHISALEAREAEAQEFIETYLYDTVLSKEELDALAHAFLATSGGEEE